MGPEPTWTEYCDYCCRPRGEGHTARCGVTTMAFPERFHIPWEEEAKRLASVLEERDRELEVERRRSNGVASHAGHWAKCARESALEAAQLRSQLTEARAALERCAEEPVTSVSSLWDRVQIAKQALKGLVPAPQDREPAT